MSYRSFVAVEVPGEIMGQAQKLITRLKQADADVKWVEPHNMHFTVKFLGNVRDNDLGELSLALAQATRDLKPFELEVVGAGAFPNIKRPRTIWLGVREGAEPFVELYEAIEDRLFDLGYRGEGRRFTPHLTLGRVRASSPGAGRLAQLLEENAEFEAGPMYVDEVVIFSSTLGPKGPTYEALGHAELQAR